MGDTSALPRLRASQPGLLTDLGWDQIVATAPGHVATVRRLVFDGLDPDEVDELARLCGAILARIDAPDPPSREDGHTHADDGR